MQANVLKSAVMCLGNEEVNETFFWGDPNDGGRELPFKNAYKYLGLTAVHDMKWDTQIDKSLKIGKFKTYNMLKHIETHFFYFFSYGSLEVPKGPWRSLAVPRGF